jgi:hypothetical protein
LRSDKLGHIASHRRRNHQGRHIEHIQQGDQGNKLGVFRRAHQAAHHGMEQHKQHTDHPGTGKDDQRVKSKMKALVLPELSIKVVPLFQHRLRGQSFQGLEKFASLFSTG